MLISTAAAFLALLQTGAATPPAPQPAACTSEEFRQLDFWVGEWELSFTQASGQPGKATNRITRDEYGACFVTEHFHQPDIDYVGTSHSTYDARRKKWVQTWVDNQGAYITLVGGPVEGQKHRFELKTIEAARPQSEAFPYDLGGCDAGQPGLALAAAAGRRQLHQQLGDQLQAPQVIRHRHPGLDPGSTFFNA